MNTPRLSAVLALGLLTLGAGCSPQTPLATSFEECVAAGKPVMESYPRQCRDHDQLFVEEVIPQAAAAFDQDLVLSVHESITMTDGLVVDVHTINDSRCPEGVVCIWAGELGVTLAAHTPSGRTQEIILGTTTQPEVTSLGYTFTLVDITETSVTLRLSQASTEDYEEALP